MKVVVIIGTIIIGVYFFAAGICNGISKDKPKWYESAASVGSLLFSVILISMVLIMAMENNQKPAVEVNNKVKTLEIHEDMTPGDTLIIVWKDKIE